MKVQMMCCTKSPCHVTYIVKYYMYVCEDCTILTNGTLLTASFALFAHLQLSIYNMTHYLQFRKA